MKLARIEYRGEVCEATVTCAGYVIEAPPSLAGTTVSEQEVRLLPPLCPVRSWAWVELREHIKEMVERAGRVADTSTSKIPRALLFFQAALLSNRHRDTIIYPFDAGRVEYEGELAVVIGRRVRRATPERRRKPSGLDLRERRHRA